MITGLLVFFLAPVFMAYLIIRIIYGLYKEYKEKRRFEEELKLRYHISDNDKKQMKKVKAFAKKNGFHRIFHLGKYQEAELYKALDAEPDKRTGKPAYILERDGNLELRTGEQGKEILRSYTQ